MNFDFIVEDVLNGLAKGKTLKDVAKKHDLNDYEGLAYLRTQLKTGIDIEFEHTKNKHTAQKIAMDHLWEDSEYYIKLEKMEKGK